MWSGLKNNFVVVLVVVLVLIGVQSLKHFAHCSKDPAPFAIYGT